VALVEGDLTRTRSNPPALAVWNAPGVTGKSVEVVKPGTNQFPLPSSQEPALTLPSPPLPPRSLPNFSDPSRLSSTRKASAGPPP
jgi:hypothetical protein